MRPPLRCWRRTVRAAALRPRLRRQPAHGIGKPVRQQRNVEYVGAVGLLGGGQQIEQQRRDALIVQALATIRLRGLKRLEPLPCAKATSA